jgi:tetratricopeptide (TPR) repeat protein
VVNAPTNNFVGAAGGYGGYGGYGAYGGYGGYGGYGWNTPYRSYYDNWYHGGWPWYRPVGYAAAAGLGWLAGAGDYAYSNPYYVEPVEAVAPELSYAQPIVIQAPPVEVTAPVTVTQTEEAPPAAAATPTVTPPAPTPAPSEPPTPAVPEDPNVRDAMAKLDEARVAFAREDYAKAQKLIEEGIKKVPGDATLHEFRALTQFAQKKYSDAAGTIYAVLAAGPGWDWDTLKTFYDSEKTYQDQLRALEAYAQANPKAADAHFLLAYHYLVLDAKDAAIKQLDAVVQLMPKDTLSAALLKVLREPPPTDRPQPKP